MTRGEAIARALHWAAFGVHPPVMIADLHGWIACADGTGSAPIVTTGRYSVSIGDDDAHAVERAACEKSKFKGLVYRALKTWAIRNDAIEYFPAMRQMYRDELARLTQKAP
jgi:hypothetical protein